MTDRKVFVGSFNNSKKEELIKLSLEKLRDNKGNEFFYILPNGELLKEYRKNFIDQVEEVFELNLFTFDDIVNNILKDDFIHIIDNPTKNLLLREVVESLMEDGVLSYYKDFIDMPGFIRSTNDIIGDIKRSLIYPEDYLKSCPPKAMYKEMGIIYSSYEALLKELSILDREGSYFKSVELLKEKNFLDGLDTIIIDEFYDFRPIELAILEQLIKSDINIMINMPFLSKSKSIILRETIELLKKLGFEIIYIEEDPASPFEAYGDYLFSDEEEIFQIDDRLSLINGASPYLELRRIFQEIKKFHKRGTPLKEMAIILTNSNYQGALHKVSKMEGIPISISKSSPLVKSPLIRELLNLLECRINNYSKLSLINRIKSNYFTICKEDSQDLYELTLRRLDFKDLDNLVKIFDRNKALNISIQEMDQLLDLINKIKDESQEIQLKAPIKSYNDELIKLIKDFKLKENILKRYKETKDESLFLRDFKSISRLEDLIDKMDIVKLIKDELSLEDYYQILIDYLEEEALVEDQGNPRGVHILNPTNSRGSKKEIIFITGLGQGSYPSIDKSNYFINDYNLQDLKNLGMDVKNYNERLSNEGLKFASIIASTKKKLYLSYSSGYDGSTIKSIFLDELLSLFKKDEDSSLVIDEIKINLDYLVKKSLKDVTNYDDLSRYLFQSYLKDGYEDLHIFNNYNKLFPGKLTSINRKILSEVNRYQDIYDDYRGLLEEENILEDIKAIRPRSFSISYLESYSKCPYFFMLNNLFQIQEMEREFEEYDPRNIGNLYHDVLSSYYQLYQSHIEREIRGSGTFLFEDTIATLEDLVYRKAEEIGLKRMEKKDSLIIEIAIKRLREFLVKDLEKQIKDKRVPSGFEVDFGYKEPFYLEYKGLKIPMVGRIDRIDKYLDKENYMAIDYKSSSYGLRNIDHMKSGLSLQLPVYILSQEYKNMVAGAYSIIKDGDSKIIMALDPHVKARGKAKLSQEEWDQIMELT